VITNRSGFFGCIVAALLVLWSPSASSQAEPGLEPAKNEFQAVGGFSVGNLHLFGYSDNRQIYPFGVEYDHRYFPGLGRLRLEYVAELLPVVLLNEPAVYNVSGHALTTDRKVVYGTGFSPVGWRLMFRKPGQFQPYVIGKGGILYFTDRVLSTEGTRLQWSAEFGAGIQKNVSNRFGYRLAYNDFHFSNGNIGRHNPGIDLMEIQMGLTYRLSRR
jgi:Lipid A 3-O-deacylase (PagL)